MAHSGFEQLKRKGYYMNSPKEDDFFNDYIDLICRVLKVREPMTIRAEKRLVARFKRYALKQCVIREELTAEQKELFAACRKFLKNLIDCTSTYKKPFYRGLLNIKDNETMVKLICVNLEELWE